MQKNHFPHPFSFVFETNRRTYIEKNAFRTPKNLPQPLKTHLPSLVLAHNWPVCSSRNIRFDLFFSRNESF
jgi:hypothetical protein